MSGAPAPVDAMQLEELHIAVLPEEKKKSPSPNSKK